VELFVLTCADAADMHEKVVRATDLVKSVADPDFRLSVSSHGDGAHRGTVQPSQPIELNAQHVSST
jgi:hypothetical protein